MKNFAILFVLVSLQAPPRANACSIFTESSGSNVLAGNNEDCPDMDADLNFVPASPEKFGKMFFNFKSVMGGFPQGGMNTAGLFFDITATPYAAVTYDEGVADFPGSSPALLQKILDEASTVDEALKIAEKYTLPGIEQAQVFFADKHGDAAILGVGKTGRLQVTRKKRHYLVLTNFNIANPAENYPCDRYEVAANFLIKNRKPTVKNFKKILSNIHVEGISSTVYSNIYDLKRGEMYLYYFHDFEEEVKINLKDELKKGARTVAVDSYFPQKPFSVRSTNETRAIFDKLIKNQRPKP